MINKDMAKVCCVRTCDERSGVNKSLLFFAFPFNNEELKNRWFRVGPGFKKVEKTSIICSKHFNPEDYAVINKGGMKKLHKNAVPSIFDPVGSDVDNEILSDDSNWSECGSYIEINVADPVEVTNQQTPNNTTDTVIERSRKRSRESRSEKRTEKKFCDVALQTCPRLVGPSAREKELQAKIHALQIKLRRREQSLDKLMQL